MNFLLDTNVLIYALQRQPGQVFHRFLFQLSERGLCFTSVISRFELLAGTREENRSKNKEFLDGFLLLEITKDIADQAGCFFQDYRQQGLTFDNEDLLLTATAIEKNLCLVTTNQKHFPTLQLVEQHHISFATRKGTRETKTVFLLTPDSKGIFKIT